MSYDETQYIEAYATYTGELVKLYPWDGETLDELEDGLSDSGYLHWCDKCLSEYPIVLNDLRDPVNCPVHGDIYSAEFVNSL